MPVLTLLGGQGIELVQGIQGPVFSQPLPTGSPPPRPHLWSYPRPRPHLGVATTQKPVWPGGPQQQGVACPASFIPGCCLSLLPIVSGCEEVLFLALGGEGQVLGGGAACFPRRLPWREGQKEGGDSGPGGERSPATG